MKAKYNKKCSWTPFKTFLSIDLVIFFHYLYFFPHNVLYMLCSLLLIFARNNDDLYYNKKGTDDTNLQSHETGFQTTIQFNLFSKLSLSCQNSINTILIEKLWCPWTRNQHLKLLCSHFKCWMHSYFTIEVFLSEILV